MTKSRATRRGIRMAHVRARHTHARARVRSRVCTATRAHARAYATQRAHKVTLYTITDIPRIFFYDGGMGELLDDITCSSPRDDGKYKHFCSDPALIAQGMRAVLTRRQHQKDLEDQVANSLPRDKAGGAGNEQAEAAKTEF